MSNSFRELLKKVGSGSHTSKDLTRAEAAAATRMMLLQEATPAQIGAFMIAHRIKRPTSEELAGMLDAYDELGPRLPALDLPSSVLVFGHPYDGRSRTAPINPLTVLILTAAGYPVLLHGGDRMPTKYGIPLIEIWQGLGVDWTKLTLEQVHQALGQSLLGLVYLPRHFPAAQTLVAYRDQIGKRPPFATLELIWCPYAGQARIISGFVHPPTETLFQHAFMLRGTHDFMTVKGLEGSVDLPRDRTAIIGVHSPQTETTFERLLLSARDYGLAGTEVPYNSLEHLLQEIQAVLEGKPSELMPAALWNGGFYLWQCGHCPDLAAGITTAEALITNGQVAAKLTQICEAVSSLQLTTSST